MCNSNQKWNNDKNIVVSTKIRKNIMHAKKIIFGIVAHVFGEYLLSFITIQYNKDNVINIINTISTNVTSTVSKYSDNKNKIF